jgi:hypothetical protein
MITLDLIIACVVVFVVFYAADKFTNTPKR